MKKKQTIPPAGMSCAARLTPDLANVINAEADWRHKKPVVEPRFHAAENASGGTLAHIVEGPIPGLTSAKFVVLEPCDEHGITVNVLLRGVSPQLAEKIARLVAREG